MIEEKDIFAENVKSYRKFFGLSQETLANKSGLDLSYIGRIERKVVCPTISTASKIAKALNVDLAVMLMQRNPNKFNDYAILKITANKIAFKKVTKKDISKNFKSIIDSI